MASGDAWWLIVRQQHADDGWTLVYGGHSTGRCGVELLSTANANADAGADLIAAIRRVGRASHVPDACIRECSQLLS